MTTRSDRRAETAPTALRELLEPVREALLLDAAAEADRVVAAATSEAHDVVASARAEADAQVEQAQHRTTLAAQAHEALLLARVRNEGHRAVLATRRRLEQQLIDEARTAVEGLRHDPRYPAVLDHLEAMARRQLGDDAVIERDAAPAGGIVAVAGARRVDYRLATLADRAIDALADEVAELWT